jgi:hypothetical protein
MSRGVYEVVQCQSIYRTVVTPVFTNSNSTSRLQSVFTGFSWLLEQTAIVLPEYFSEGTETAQSYSNGLRD